MAYPTLIPCAACGKDVPIVNQCDGIKVRIEQVGQLEDAYTTEIYKKRVYVCPYCHSSNFAESDETSSLLSAFSDTCVEFTEIDGNCEFGVMLCDKCGAEAKIVCESYEDDGVTPTEYVIVCPACGFRTLQAPPPGSTD